MAKLKNISLEKIIDQNGFRVPVGSNREIAFSRRNTFAAETFSGFLYGHEIFKYSPLDKKIWLYPSGYLTRTTRMAMYDFLSFFKIDGVGLSFAKEKFHVRYDGTEYETNGQSIVLDTKGA